MHPIILKGRPAFSDFRLAALKKALNEAIDAHEIAEIDAVECYFIEAANSLDDTTNERAIFLLGAQEHFNHADEGGFYVTPRKGTISPWSTKATDIFHNCALEAVERVERGIHFPSKHRRRSRRRHKRPWFGASRPARPYDRSNL